MFRSRNKNKAQSSKLSKKELGSLWSIYKKYLGPYWMLMGVGTICLMLTTIASLIFPMIMKDMIDAELNTISKSINNIGINIKSAMAKSLLDKKGSFIFEIEVKDYSELLKVIGCIEGLSEVISVHRI